MTETIRCHIIKQRNQVFKECNMKKSLIEDIFYGRKGQYDTIKESKEYWKLNNKAAKLSEKLAESFTAKQKELFNKLNCIVAEQESEAALTHFAEGFKIGLLIGIECAEE